MAHCFGQISLNSMMFMSYSKRSWKPTSIRQHLKKCVDDEKNAACRTIDTQNKYQLLWGFD